MEDKARSADSFGTFLKIVQGKGRTGPGSDAQTSDDPPIQLLLTLDAAGPLATEELWSRTGLDLAPFTSALMTVREGGYVRSAGDPEAGMVEITKSGAKLAAVARGDT